MLDFWGKCTDVDDDTDFDTAFLTKVNEDAEEVSAADLEEVLGQDVEHFLSVYDIEEAIFAVYPNMDTPEAAFIYDIEKDVHYLFW